MADADAKVERTFDVEYAFSKRARAYGYRMKGVDRDDALRKCEEAIVDGTLDLEKFEELGGETSNGTWSTKHGDDFDYEIDEDGVTPVEGEDEEDAD